MQSLYDKLGQLHKLLNNFRLAEVIRVCNKQMKVVFFFQGVKDFCTFPGRWLTSVFTSQNLYDDMYKISWISIWNLLNCPTVYHLYSWNNSCRNLSCLFCGCCTARETVVPLLSNCYRYFFFILKKPRMSIEWSAANTYLHFMTFILQKTFT